MAMFTSPSSANTFSSPMPFVATAPAQPGSIMGPPDYLTPQERKEREELKTRLRERVAFQQMARNLRAKLQYAAYKVRHNVAHLTFQELEASARQEVAPARILNPSTQARDFVAAATAAAKSEHGSFQRRVPTAPPRIIRPSAATSNLRNPPESATHGANAIQSLYASILAQPPPRRARTIHNTHTQYAPTPSSSKQTGSSRTRKDCLYDDDDDDTSVTKRTRKADASKASASATGSKRKAPANTSRSKVNKRKRGDDAAAASRDEDEDLQAAATLTDLFLNSRSGLNIRNVKSPLSQSDVLTSRSSLGYHRGSARTQPGISPLIQSTVVPSHGSPPPSARGEAPSMQLTAMVGSSATASTVSFSRHPTVTGSSSTGTVDQEAVKLLYYLHESPSPADSDVQGGKRVFYQGEVVRPASSNAARAVGPAHKGSTSARSRAPSTERLPPHVRKLCQESMVVVDPTSSARDVEMREANALLPIVRITPPTPTAPALKVALRPQDDVIPQASLSSSPGAVYAMGPPYTRALHERR